MSAVFNYPPCPGKTFFQIFNEAKAAAKALGVDVLVTFNGIEVTIREDSCLADSNEILALKQRIERMYRGMEQHLTARA